MTTNDQAELIKELVRAYCTCAVDPNPYCVVQRVADAVEDLERKIAARDEVIKGYERDMGIAEATDDDE